MSSITPSLLYDYIQCPHKPWRDKTPSGALSIQWFNEYLEKRDPAMLQRILEYNEDDCIATMVIKDKIEKLT